MRITLGQSARRSLHILANFLLPRRIYNDVITLRKGSSYMSAPVWNYLTIR